MIRYTFWNFTLGLFVGFQLYGFSYLLDEPPHYIDQIVLDFPIKIKPFSCDFEKIPLDLNEQVIDFECRGNPFSLDDLVGESKGEGSWGRFGRNPILL